MGIFPRQENNSVISSIAAVRQAWLEAVKAGDVEWLASLVTDDVVVVHGNG
jgi:ketosteroid isomerase-like protein